MEGHRGSMRSHPESDHAHRAEPRPEVRDAYAAAGERYRALYPAARNFRRAGRRDASR